MTLRQLLAELELEAADGSRLNEDILIEVGRERRTLQSSYRDHVFILVAGPPAQ